MVSEHEPESRNRESNKSKKIPQAGVEPLQTSIPTSALDHSATAADIQSNTEENQMLSAKKLIFDLSPSWKPLRKN